MDWSFPALLSWAERWGKISKVARDSRPDCNEDSHSRRCAVWPFQRVLAISRERRQEVE